MMFKFSLDERPRPKGSTLIVIVVSLMVLTIAAAVAAPLLFSANDQIAAQRTGEILNSVRVSLDKNATDATGNVGWCSQIGKCPASLSQLTSEIAVGDNCCCNTGGTFSSKSVGNWLSQAPFSGLPIVKGVGLPTPLGIIHDSLVLSGTSHIELHIDSVPQYRAVYLDSMVDGAVNAAAGAIQYALSPGTTAAKNLYLVKFIMTSGLASCP
jgi:type II secretory pathway pseudopilin PulG